MSERTKKIVAIIVTALFVLAAVLPLSTLFVHAATKAELQQKLNKDASAKNKINNTIKQSQTQKNDVLARKKANDQKLDTLKDKISSLNSAIAQDNANIGVIQKDLDAAQVAVKKQYDTYKKRIKVMYVEGNSGYLDALLQSTSITDFLNRYEIISSIATYDKNMVDKLDQTRKEIENKKTALVQVKEQKESSVKSLNSEKASLDAVQRENDAIVNELNTKIDTSVKELKKIEAEENSTRAQIAQLSVSYSSSAPAKYVGGSMDWPAPGYYTITSPYGYRYHPVLKVNKLHTGVDIGAPYGAKILAANDGVVIQANFNNAYGKHIIINHGGGLSTLYAHASSLMVKAGQEVKRGQQIGRVGSTGYSTGAHLHFEVIVNGSTTNPMSYFK